MASRLDPGGSSRFAKLGMAINDVLTQAYRDILEMDVPPSLAFNKVKSSSLYKKLRSDQELLLIDAKNSGYKNFDITFMYTLLRNICTTIPPPTNAWGGNDMPSTIEITIGDDIERIRLIRNSVFGHVYSASTSQQTFDDSWSVISDVCQRLQTYTGKTYMDGLQNIERQALEEEYEEALVEKLREEHENNKELREDMSTLLSDVKEIKAGMHLNKISCQQRNIDTQDGPKFEKDGPVSLNEAIIANWKMENKTFVPTLATKAVEEKLQNQNFVIVVGNSGSGKTATIQHIALKYQRQGWDIVPIDEVREIKEMCSRFFTRRLFIMNDPIGKEKLDEISKHSWESLENTIEICLEKSKMLISCRRCVIKDNVLQGLFREQSNIVEIDSGSNVLTDEEKVLIIKQYVKEGDLSKNDIDEIIKTDAYFPLLCKLLAVNRHYLGDH
ncbi:uncharacterized protein LOC134280330 [Saccostrea cucullata]|uniref:uncharacterized protein LOC134280330 n=1 Tax=Saccostrea cuccullata TaxID=36930 RepID=UPI002ED33822